MTITTILKNRSDKDDSNIIDEWLKYTKQKSEQLAKHGLSDRKNSTNIDNDNNNNSNNNDNNDNNNNDSHDNNNNNCNNN